MVVNMAIIIINAFTNLKRVKKAVSRMMNISVAGYMALEFTHASVNPLGLTISRKQKTNQIA